ncbi:MULTISPECIES: hypothetical protein [unclassified Agromyces]|uniref:hypothetical protein n=1 Tax=unclassified Agromyces TaxID=2639701 RepID=UPI00301458D7
MGDPLNPWESQDRLAPAGDLNENTPDLTGRINTIGGGRMSDSSDTIGGATSGGHGDALLDPDTADREARDAQQAAAGGVGDTGPQPAPSDTDRDTDAGPDANDLEADNAVEQDTVETVDPDNPPA